MDKELKALLKGTKLAGSKVANRMAFVTNGLQIIRRGNDEAWLKFVDARGLSVAAPELIEIADQLTELGFKTELGTTLLVVTR